MFGTGVQPPQLHAKLEPAGAFPVWFNPTLKLVQTVVGVAVKVEVGVGFTVTNTVAVEEGQPVCETVKVTVFTPAVDQLKL